ncbi:hypothetical protein [Salinispira pacifica]|uniref:Uncharacterized protein n=1 Tax=Salinispira pacifica TaxID=1307761 RepID=V5WJ01_9SPIO|nr:hypothetical protein [Salinispira pacifica]AHC15817.1 hypothetical protein L21SP2_2464 [Salinispira pacifica]
MIHFFVNSLEQIILLVLSGVLSFSLLETAGKIDTLERLLHIRSSTALLGLMGNALMIFLLGWKLAPLIFQFRQVVSTPIMLLYAPGGFPGTIIGLVLALLYLLPLGRRRKNAWKDALRSGETLNTQGSEAPKTRKIRPFPALMLQAVIALVLWSGLYSIMLRLFEWWSASRLGVLAPPG